MPKKFQGENSKSSAARARKAEAKAVADARKQKELEDALWQESDKHVLKKEQRKVRNCSEDSIANCSLAEKRAKESKTGVSKLRPAGHLRPVFFFPFSHPNNPNMLGLLFSTKEDTDRHPERRMKAAYAAFEEVNMPRLKMENPNMRLSQLKQQLKKEWTKSPENPLNQRFVSYNTK
uniref:Coiled-coil domain containing 124 n=1 Tax=Astyanax mexicanus TaxID=7994 RepID=A0A8B9LGK4_ASTMX